MLQLLKFELFVVPFENLWAKKKFPATGLDNPFAFANSET